VQAVRGGTARREEIEGWVKQIHCTTGYYREILESQNV
jgi:hypothetical protein